MQESKKKECCFLNINEKNKWNKTNNMQKETEDVEYYMRCFCRSYNNNGYLDHTKWKYYHHFSIYSISLFCLLPVYLWVYTIFFFCTIRPEFWLYNFFFLYIFMCIWGFLLVWEWILLFYNGIFNRFQFTTSFTFKLCLCFTWKGEKNSKIVVLKGEMGE